MDALDFQSLVDRLEHDSAKDAGAYRRRVAALAVLGYAYVFGMLLLLVAAVVGEALAMLSALLVIAIKLLIPSLVVIGSVVSALWVKLEPPGGFLLPRERAPELFGLIDEVQRALRAPPVHVVLMDGALNAAIVQIPQFGPLGWYKNYLVIGLPLLQATDPDEWRAILAHEMGHLSGNHGRFSSWVYRIRMTWSRLLAGLEQKRSRLGALLFGKFLHWYAPYFIAYSFVLARQHEYEADRASAELTGRETARRAMLRLHLAGHLLGERFWPALYGAAADTAEPPPDPFKRMDATLRAQAEPAEAARWITAGWEKHADVDDTHPALADRLRALGWTGTDAPSPPGPIEGPTAAERFLGAAEHALRAAMDEAWSKGIASSWRERHEEILRQRERLGELDAKDTASLTVEEAWERIAIVFDLGPEARAEPLVRELLAREPRHVSARFLLGRLLLQEGDPAGVDMIEGVMADEPDTTMPGCGLLDEFFRARGDPAAAVRYRMRAEEYRGALEKAREERRRFPASTRFDPHGLSDEQVADIRRRLAAFKQVKRAYLARRRVRWLPERPAYALCLVPRGWFVTQKRTKQLVHEVAQRTPEGIVVFVTPHRRVRRRIKKQPGSRLL